MGHQVRFTGTWINGLLSPSLEWDGGDQTRECFRPVFLKDFGRDDIRREDSRLDGVDSDRNFPLSKVSCHGRSDLLQRCFCRSIGKLKKIQQSTLAISDERDGETYAVVRQDRFHGSGTARDVDDTGGAVYAGPCALLQELQECRSYKEWCESVEFEDRMPSLETFEFVRNLSLCKVAELLGSEVGLAERGSDPSAIISLRQ